MGKKYYRLIKKNGILSVMVTWMEQEDILLGAMR
jgi:hypothetical protein